jgi:hypothetical protein
MDEIYSDWLKCNTLSVVIFGDFGSLNFMTSLFLELLYIEIFIVLGESLQHEIRPTDFANHPLSSHE